MPEYLAPLALIGVVLVLSGLASGAVERGPISFPILFLGLGFLLGRSGLLPIQPHDLTLEVVAVVSLAFVLFLDALKLRPDEIGKSWFVPMLVLGPGTLLVIALVALAAWLLLGTGPVESLLLGAILASTDPVVLRDVLRNSFDEEHRAIAAYVIGYAADKKAVVDDLQFALRDPDETVRNNAMRALAAIEVLARRRPTLGLRIQPTWMIEMLNSLVWTDRATAAVNLVNLTEDRDPEMLAHIEDRALDSLLEMAAWKHLGHALPAFILLGRVAGMKEQEIQEAWRTGDREKVLARGRELARRRKR